MSPEFAMVLQLSHQTVEILACWMYARESVHNRAPVLRAERVEILAAVGITVLSIDAHIRMSGSA